MAPSIIKAKDFKPENVRFSEPKVNKKGGKMLYIKYDFQDGEEPKPLRIQMSKMKAPFGTSGWDNDRADKTNSNPTENSNDTLELSFKEEHKDIIEKFEKLNEYAMEEAAKNSQKIFKKKYTLETLKLFFKSPIKFNENAEGDRDDEYPPRIKTKMIKDSSNSYITQVYDNNKKRIDFNIHNHSEVLPKGSECVSIVECSGIWIVNDNFGLSWKPVQLKIYKNESKLTECEIVESDEEEGAESEAEAVEEEAPVEAEEDHSADLFDDLDSAPTPAKVAKAAKSKKRA